MIIDDHTHIGVRCEADWDFENVAEHMRHDQRRLAAIGAFGRFEVRKYEDDSVVEEGWKTLWNERLLNSWEGAYDVNFRIEREKKRAYNIQWHPPIFVWEKDGVKYYNTPVIIDSFKAAPPEVLLSLMNKVGVDRAVLHQGGHSNKFFSRVMHEYPRRFIGLCQVEESTAYTKEGIEKLRVNIEELGLKGLYHEPYPGWEGFGNFHTDKYDPFWRKVSSLGIPAYICGPHYRHFDKGVLPKLKKLLKKFPSLTLMLVHGLPPWFVREGIPKIAKDIVKNYDVYLELLPKLLDYGPNDEIIRSLYDTFGPSKLVWGSECAVYAIHHIFTAERYSEYVGYLKERCDYMSKDDLRLIMGGNVQRIFGI